MIDTLKGIADFFAEFGLWAKILMLLGLALTLGTMFLAPRNKTKPVEGVASEEKVPKVESLFTNDLTKDELMAKLFGDKRILGEHLKSSKYDDILVFNNVKVKNATFDFVVYCHNDAQNQMGRPMLFISLHEPNAKAVNWDDLDNDWHNISENILWDDVKHALERLNGFKYPLERSTALGIEKPHIYYLQLVGRRDDLSQFDISSMSERHTPQANSFFRIVATYDLMIDEFRPLIQ